MSNLAVFILIIMYVAICAVVVGYWAFGTMAGQDKSIQDKLDEDFDQGDLLSMPHKLVRFFGKLNIYYCR